MKVIFEADSGIDRSVTKVITHPTKKEHWENIKEAIHSSEKKIVVINAKNNRNVQILLSSIAAIESEDRMCNVRVITGEMFLLNTRLKSVERMFDSLFFLKINNQTIINTCHIKTFSSTDNARIKVVLTDSTSYFVSRHYLKKFRGHYND